MNKLKLLALIYSSEDRRSMTEWLNANESAFEIVEWSNPLDVPIQSAVAHFLDSTGIDGLLIDDHHGYDPIVMSRLSDLMKPSKMALYSATNAVGPIIATKPDPCVQPAAIETKNLFLLDLSHRDSGNVASAQQIRVAV